MLTLEGFPYNVFCADAAVINETPKKIIGAPLRIMIPKLIYIYI